MGWLVSSHGDPFWIDFHICLRSDTKQDLVLVQDKDLALVQQQDCVLL